MQGLIRWWNHVSHYGIEADMTISKQKRIILSNQLGVIVTVIALTAGAGAVFVIGSTASTMGGITIALVMSSVPSLNKRGYTRVSRLLLVTIPPLVFISNTIMNKQAFLADTGTIPIALYFNPRLMILGYLMIPLMLLDRNDRLQQIIGLGPLLLFVIFLDPIHEWFGLGIHSVTYTHEREGELAIYESAQIYTIVVVVALIVGIWFLRSINMRYEAVLSEKNEEINTQNEELRSSREELKQNLDQLHASQEYIKEQNGQLSAAYEELEAKSTRITDSISYARLIQQAFLPLGRELREYFRDYFLIYRPKDVVSGDFYWAERIGTDGSVFAAVADCTGHGVPGAFMAMLGNSLFNEAVDRNGLRSPARILDFVHAGIQQSLKQAETGNADGMDAVFCRIIRTDDRVEVIFAGAKNSLFYVEGDTCKRLKGDRYSIGGFRKRERPPYTDHNLTLKAGDSLYLTTDGFMDQADPDRERFGVLRFQELIQAAHHLKAPEQQAYFEQALDEHRQDEEQRDDITLLAFLL